jgi:hypothetical protein
LEYLRLAFVFVFVFESPHREIKLSLPSDSKERLASHSVNEASLPNDGVIRIEWTIGSDPSDYDTYSWSVTCEPEIPDEVVDGILTEVLRVY